MKFLPPFLSFCFSEHFLAIHDRAVAAAKSRILRKNSRIRKIFAESAESAKHEAVLFCIAHELFCDFCTFLQIRGPGSRGGMAFKTAESVDIAPGCPYNLHDCIL
jgi:hypothetical protein